MGQGGLYKLSKKLIDKAREHLGLSDLEKHTEGGGILHVHIGDALSTSSSVSGGYAGIVIDLFSGGEVLPQLQEVQTWLELNDKLMPNGRLMVNWKMMPKSDGENYLALTGPLPDLTMWAAALPDRLSSSIKQWSSCFPS
ncbi:hypothetical protein L6452_26378 [Arctium lappa]|uniref:Uncharacterized protein n=1 Tax=Arctium lappa TaxID=4217 RepID=A0ACB8ZVL5_ARCLA|nr:hypothetical protein L6452_26378 [Arctium lappa]